MKSQELKTANQAQSVEDGLAKLLAESYTLYLKTQNYHWNVTGPHFKFLHEMFQEHYEELATAVDEIAERLRALGHKAPGSYREFSQLSSVPEATGNPSWQEMVNLLVEAHQIVSKTASEVLPLAQAAGDEVSADLLVGRMSVHEKTVWMLKSTTE